MYPFCDLEVGYYFDVPLSEAPLRKTAQAGKAALIARVGSAINYAQNKRYPGRKFAYRTLPDRIRVWRVANSSK